jgi:hypothetical protein
MGSARSSPSERDRVKKTEPSAYLAGNKGQPKLAYVHSTSTDIAARFARMRDEKLAADPLLGVLQLHKKVKR